ncbi:transposable element Tc3 transposase [Trichonephila clavipes]|nr:transposable element Tc3 transposase [Trichonephila clavipes]
MRITGNHQIAWIVRHNDESVREVYIRTCGNEVKLFTIALKDFKSDNRIVMVQRKNLYDFLRSRIIGRPECRGSTSTSWKYPRNLESPRVSSPDFGNDSKIKSDSRRTLIWRAHGTRYHQENAIERYRYGGAGWLVWGGIILGSRTDNHDQSVTMAGHIYRDVILEQHVRLFWGTI